MLKLYHCDEESWGCRNIKGKPLPPSSSYPKAMMGKNVILAQAVLSHGSRPCACCLRDGEQVVEIAERHFLQQWKGKWQLHLVRAVATANSTTSDIRPSWVCNNNNHCNDSRTESSWEKDNMDGTRKKKRKKKKKTENGDNSEGDDVGDEENIRDDSANTNSNNNNHNNHNNHNKSIDNNDSNSSRSGWTYTYFLQPQHLILNQKTLLQPSMMRMELAHYFRPILSQANNRVHLVIVMDCIRVDRTLCKTPSPKQRKVPKVVQRRLLLQGQFKKKEPKGSSSPQENDDDDTEAQSLCSFLDDLTTASTSSSNTMASNYSSPITRLDFLGTGM